MDRQSSSKKHKAVLEEKIDNYIDGFTVHGLTRVFKSPRQESIFWLVVLIVGLLLAVIVLYTLIKKYYDFEIYTEIKSVLTDKNAFPSLSICEMNLLSSYYFLYCGSTIRSYDSNNNTYCDRSKVANESDSDVVMQKQNWTNGLFDVVQCFGWDGQNCLSPEHFKSHPLLKHSCITWNYNGNMSDSYGHVDMTVIFRGRGLRGGKPKIVAIPHDSRIVEIDLTKKVNLDPRKSYEIKVQKTSTKRLPSPYPSKCVTEENAMKLDITPGAYSRRTCLESHQMLHAYKECGSVFDYMQNFIPKDIKEKYERNRTNNEIKKCIEKAVFGSKPDREECPFPCDELDLGITSTFNEYDSPKYRQDHVYNINIQLQSIDSYSIMEEKPLYSADQLTCEIGGFLGLVMGASLLSFIEIIFCSTLMVAKKWYAKYDN